MGNTFWKSKKIVLLFVTILLFGCHTKSSKKEVSKKEITKTATKKMTDFKISLAQWSLHRAYFGKSISSWGALRKMLKNSPNDALKGRLNPTNFPTLAASYGIYSIELVNTFYLGKIDDDKYWVEFKKQCKKEGVSVELIMCDLIGKLTDPDDKARMEAVKNHHKWVDLASFLGAHSIRVNVIGQGTPEEVAADAIDGLSKLAKYAASKEINIIVENHGGYSSDGMWLSEVMRKIKMDNVGTLPDFGNFCLKYTDEGCVEEYDRYKGISELMPYAKGVSAKSHDFDENGNETKSDFLRIMRIVKKSGYKGCVGIEYEGKRLSEEEGIKATKTLLEKVFKEL